MKHIRVAISAALLLACFGCNTPDAETPSQPTAKDVSITSLVQTIVSRAKQNDTQYFEAFLGESYKNQASSLITQINNSNMLANHAERLNMKTDNSARLNYHYLEKGCHFQIDLVREGGSWKVKGIWFCR